MKKFAALLLIVVTLVTFSACGSKDALAGTWSAELEYDGVITWTFDGNGKCTMENAYMKQNGTYTIEDDQLTVTLETWDEPSTYTFSVDDTSLTMNENSVMVSVVPLRKNSLSINGMCFLPSNW